MGRAGTGTGGEAVAAVVADTWDGLPLADGCVDLVQVVFAPRNPSEFARVLRPGGTLVVAREEDRIPGRSGTRVVLDPVRRLPGRGAHLHPDGACVERAVQRRAIPIALRLPGNVDLSEVIEWADRLTARTDRREELDMEAGHTR